MQLLTTQRIIANGLAQLRFEEVWPEHRGPRPDGAPLGDSGFAQARRAARARRPGRRRAGAQGRRLQPVAPHADARPLGRLATSCGEAGLRAAFFTGHEGQRRRTQNIVDFHDDPAVRVLFATDAGGVGLNLQRAASCCVNLELPWNPAVLEQRIGRIYRLGQKAPIDVYNLVTQTCIEARIAGLVSAKKALFTGLFDGDSNEVQFERSGAFLERLQHLVTPVAAPELPPVVDEPVEAQAAVEQALDDVVAEADESGDAVPAAETVGAAAASPAPLPAVQPDAVRRLFSQLTIPPEGGRRRPHRRASRGGGWPRGAVRGHGQPLEAEHDAALRL